MTKEIADRTIKGVQPSGGLIMDIQERRFVKWE